MNPFFSKPFLWVALLALCLFGSTYTYGQTASGVKWDQTYGGDHEEYHYWGNIKLEVDPAGGFYVGGISKSGISGEKTDTCRGLEDYWVLRLDANGSVIWDKTYGADNKDILNNVRIHPSGDLILLGISNSPGTNGDKSVPNYTTSPNNSDLWVMRIDDTGTKIWDQIYGSSKRENAIDFTIRPSGEILLGGLTLAFTLPDGDVTEAVRGFEDNWIIDIDPNSTAVLSETRWGGSERDGITRIIPDGSGGFFVLSYANGPASFELPGPERGDWDIVVYKLNSTGGIIWSSRVGSSGREDLSSIVATPSGGVIVATSTEGDADGDRARATYGKRDYWVFALDNTGQLLWEKVFGGTKDDEPYDIIRTCDGHYLIGGYSYSGPGGNRTSPSKGESDMWFIKIDEQGNKLWEYAAGGAGDDGATDLEQFPDGTYGAVGYSDSNVSGDKSQPSRGRHDIWLINLAVTADFIPPTACVGQEAQFLDASTSFTQTWSWDFGDPASGGLNQSTLQNPTHAYTTPGTYTVTLIAGEGCHADTVVQTVTVSPTPVANTGPDQIVCPGTALNLGGPATAGVSYEWSPGTGLSQTQISNPAFTAGYGTYAYTLIASDGICADTQAVQIVRMGIDAGPDGEICAGEAHPLGNLPAQPGITYAWSPSAEVSNPSAPQAQFMPANGGSTTLTLTATGGNCVLTDQVNVYTSPPITAGFVVDPETPVPGMPADVLYIGTGANTFVWSNGASGAQTQYLWEEAGEYLISLTASDSGRCDVKESQLIKVDPDVILYIPNTFSPNGDGLNDEFSFVIDRHADFEMQVFDRWGKLVFSTNSTANFWRGEDMPEGNYVWVLSGTSLAGRAFVARGGVLLMR